MLRQAEADIALLARVDHSDEEMIEAIAVFGRAVWDVIDTPAAHSREMLAKLAVAEELVREAEEDSEFGDDRIAALIRFVRADLREFARKLTIN